MTVLLRVVLCVSSASGVVPGSRLPRPRRERLASPGVGPALLAVGSSLVRDRLVQLTAPGAGPKAGTRRRAR